MHSYLYTYLHIHPLQVALHCSLSPGAIVLNGMRTDAHVADALAVLQSEPLVPGG